MGGQNYCWPPNQKFEGEAVTLVSTGSGPHVCNQELHAKHRPHVKAVNACKIFLHIIRLNISIKILKFEINRITQVCSLFSFLFNLCYVLTYAP